MKWAVKSIWLIEFLAASLGTSAVGCPEISGDFQCENGTLPKFQFFFEDEIPRYHVNGLDFVVDSRQHKFVNPEMVMNYSSTCENNKWHLSTTIFNKKSGHLQVGTENFVQLDKDSFNYEREVSIYSNEGKETFPVPILKMNCQKQ